MRWVGQARSVLEQLFETWPEKVVHVLRSIALQKIPSTWYGRHCVLHGTACLRPCTKLLLCCDVLCGGGPSGALDRLFSEGVPSQAHLAHLAYVHYKHLYATNVA